MTTAALGLVTLGQTPRPDLLALLRGYHPDGEVHLVGALDDLPPADQAGLDLGDDTYLLRAQLADGGVARVSLEAVEPLIAARAAALAQTCDLVVVLCGGDFQRIEIAGTPLVLPGRLAPAVIGNLGVGRRLGVVTPIEQQAPFAMAKWRADGFDPVVVTCPPQADTAVRHHALREIGARLRAEHLDAVLLDCFSFGTADSRVLHDVVGAPVVSLQDLTWGVVAAWMGYADRASP